MSQRIPSVSEEQHKRLMAAQLRATARRSKAQVQAEEKLALLVQASSIAKQRRHEMTHNGTIPISDRDVLQRSLVEVFEFSSFLPGQEEAITRGYF